MWCVRCRVLRAGQLRASLAASGTCSCSCTLVCFVPTTLLILSPEEKPAMVLQTARTFLSELAHVIRPWTHAPAGSQLVNLGGLGLADVGSVTSNDHVTEDLFGPVWFAVPKKRVSRERCTSVENLPSALMIPCCMHFVGCEM